MDNLVLREKVRKTMFWAIGSALIAGAIAFFYQDQRNWLLAVLVATIVFSGAATVAWLANTPFPDDWEE